MLARIVHLLALHPDVQEKLRQEIIAASGDEDFSYNQLMQLSYLDSIIRETLRVWVSYLSACQLRFSDQTHRYAPVTCPLREYVPDIVSQPDINRVIKISERHDFAIVTTASRT